jgi:hypothetical protein
MRAFVSGQSGIALLNDGSHWSVLRGADGSVLQGQCGSAIRLLDGSTDIEEVPDADTEEVGLELATARAKDTALQYVLVLIQETEIGELERRILARLQDLLPILEVQEFILNRLYAAPLGLSDLDHIKDVIAEDSQHPVSAIFRSVLGDQASIGRVKSAWESISTGRFRSVEEKDEFFFSAVQRGLVRRLVRGAEYVAQGPDDASTWSGEIERAWAEAAGDGSAGFSDRCPSGGDLRTNPSMRPSGDAFPGSRSLRDVRTNPSGGNLRTNRDHFRTEEPGSPGRTRSGSRGDKAG